jgi:hypothetical protein
MRHHKTHARRRLGGSGIQRGDATLSYGSLDNEAEGGAWICLVLRGVRGLPRHFGNTVKANQRLADEVGGIEPRRDSRIIAIGYCQEIHPFRLVVSSRTATNTRRANASLKLLCA